MIILPYLRGKKVKRGGKGAPRDHEVVARYCNYFLLTTLHSLI